MISDTTTSKAVREFRQELFAEHVMYARWVEQLRPDAGDAGTHHAQAYAASLMAAQFAFGLVAALRLAETRFGSEAAEALASDVRHVMDDEWLGPDLADDLDQPAGATP